MDTKRLNAKIINRLLEVLHEDDWADGDDLGLDAPVEGDLYVRNPRFEAGVITFEAGLWSPSDKAPPAKFRLKVEEA